VPEAIRILREVPIAQRDGTLTRAEVWLPAGRQRSPAILVRTPYGKELAAPLPIVDPREATSRGYAVVLQDVRGRGSSEGEFLPFVAEERDGADSVAWVAEQPWSDGRVVMAGMSYVGATQWLAAVAAPPALHAINPTLSADAADEGWSYSSGVREHGFLTSWIAANLVAPELQWLDDPERAYDDAAALAAIAPWAEDWHVEAPGSPYWASRSVAGRRDAVCVPALVVAGLYDVFLRGSLASFARSRDPRDRLVLGPWGHDPALSHLVGDANVGIAGAGAAWGFASRQLDWYDDVLAGREPRLPRVSAYVLGAHRWLGLPSWPPPGPSAVTVPLGAATLSVDPVAPAPSLGGRGLLVMVPGWGWGVRDQRPLLGRPDVAVAARHSVVERLLATGPVRARLAVGGGGGGRRQWVVTLCREQADGALHNLAEGIAEAPAEADEVAVHLGDVSVELPPGSTLVVLVAGCSFPRWPRPAAAGSQELRGGALELTAAPCALLDDAP
jgi:uncharacterized protein